MPATSIRAGRSTLARRRRSALSGILRTSGTLVPIAGTSGSTPPGQPLADVLPGPDDPPPAVLFCGINPGRTAQVDGLYFSRSGNRFWPVLHRAGFTPHVFAPEEQFRLPSLGIGITSLVSRPTSRADELSAAELRAGVPALIETAERLRPRWVGFLGVTAFRVAFASPRAGFGPQERDVGGARMWVLPNPSGLNRSWPLDRLVDEYGRFRRAAVSPGSADRSVGQDRATGAEGHPWR